MRNTQKTITIFCPLTVPFKSGAGINAFNLAKEFLKLNYKVRIISFRKGDYQIFEKIEDIDIVRIPYIDVEILKILSYFTIIPLFLYYLIKTDLAIVFGPLQGYMALFIGGQLFNKKVVFRSTMYGVDDLYTLNRKFGLQIYKLRRKINGLMGGYISQSPAMTSSFLEEYKMSIPVFESANGVNTEKFKPVSIVEKRNLRESLNLNIDKNTKIILSIGYVIERKGYREVFDSMMEFVDEDFVYLIIGKYHAGKNEYMYHERENMKRLYSYGKEKLKEKVVFIGECENVADYLKIADIFILNSQKEGMPNVLLEAMSSSVPVIVKSLPGVDKYITINKENSLVVNEEQSLQQALSLLFENENLANNLAKKSREFILENYNFTIIAKNMIDAFIP